MAPLKLTVTGNSTIYHNAERAVVSIFVSSDGPDQAQVSKNVTTTANELRTILKDMALKDESGKPTSDAPITHWTMTTLSTSSRQPTDDKGNKLIRQYHASARFEVKFQDFAELGSFATSLSIMEHVSIQSIAWRLTDATMASLGSQSRREAVDDAINKAKDFAAVLRPTYKQLVATTVSGSYLNTSISPHLGMKMRKHRAAVGTAMAMNEDEGEINFEPEAVTLGVQVSVEFEAE